MTQTDVHDPSDTNHPIVDEEQVNDEDDVSHPSGPIRRTASPPPSLTSTPLSQPLSSLDTKCIDKDDVDFDGNGGGGKILAKKYFGFTKRQLCTLIVFINSNLFAGTVMSIQSPFYPKEAEEKGATPSEYGFVFGIFHLTMFIASPIYGSLLGTLSPKLIFTAGTFVTGFSTILFGFLDFVNNRIGFIVSSFALRIISAAGQSANIAATFTIIAMDFPDSVSTTFASLETCFGLGLIVGPSLGGVLYELGGFVLPFLVMGFLMMLTSILAQFLLASIKPFCQNDVENGGDSANGGKNQFGFIALLKLPAVALAAASICVSSSSIGFLNATLEPHLRLQFNLTPIYTGLMFIIDGSMYAISAPFWGKLCGSWITEPKFVTLIGCGLTFTGFIFIGPIPMMPFGSILWVTILGLCIHGLGMGASFVSSFLQGMRDSVAYGFPDSVATYGLVSGMWVSFLALGSFIGPSVGGILLDYFGFEWASLYVLASQIFMASWTIIFVCVAKVPKSSSYHYDNRGESMRREFEKEPLLSSSKKFLVDNTDSSVEHKSPTLAHYGST